MEVPGLLVFLYLFKHKVKRSTTKMYRIAMATLV